MAPEVDLSRPGFAYCDACEMHVPNGQLKAHYTYRAHLRKTRMKAYMEAISRAENDNGITISHADVGADFGIMDFAAVQANPEINITVRATSGTARIAVIEARVVKALNSAPTTCFIASVKGAGTRVPSAEDLHVVVKFTQHPPQRGRYEARLEIVFEDADASRRFEISRIIKAVVGDPQDHELLKPVAPYVKPTRRRRTAETEVVQAELPPSLSRIQYRRKLPDAKIPDALLSVLEKRASSQQITGRIREGHLPPALNETSYSTWYQTLIWAEEYKQEKDIQAYDMHGVRLRSAGALYYLQVPGLAENRPSVIVGDRILVQPTDVDQGKWFEGRVFVVALQEVGMRLNSAFGAHKDKTCNVRFQLNRHPLRVQHQALKISNNPSRLLFPEPEHIAGDLAPSPEILEGPRFDERILQNSAQLQAITSIVHRKPGAVPFVLFGPPGTGKTFTILEAIKQLLRVGGDKVHILAIAPTNAAADLIALGLTYLDDDLFRMYAPTRRRNLVPETLLPFTAMTADGGNFTVPDLDRLLRYKVVVATCISAAIPYSLRIPEGHFSHIFLDEAGQAAEPEAMVSIRMLATSKTNIILSGDPKQLGPVIRSGVARDLGLGKSYLERLMERKIYDVVGGYGVTVVKLVNNFRSHTTILQYPNVKFYAGDLRPCACAEIVDSYIGWPGLPSSKFPVIFHSIIGKDDRESTSPSYFNIDEISQVKAYVQDLLGNAEFPVEQHDIGIITPYHAQSLKIRAALRAIHLTDIKVGSTELFQGQERRVIIVSTVRSSQELLTYDLRHTLGFVSNPRRFNVAVTRAKALLIVVGNPNVLSLDPLWRGFLNYVHQNGGWTGQSSIGWDPTEPVKDGGYDADVRAQALEELNAQFAKFGIEPIVEDAEPDSDVVNEDLDNPERQE
ncbi:P-loop containing nucleoside triphosphate hydrolase protein [Punctularia strigosozonata HHB-11173 SS5]|uniref:P-loop containing nucleoside triphosphate hydrolase protein n=1 Tax=Punctularia strigosozonata (strain HHB-11173) TaxID=741275 RepID=UPI000441845A|nr:P-loop containing nucleoside triphosphate hydrolase protein [Punctularia strigosozonata HHB-11173 SS5]EIN09073.1 P-loop containing nucleoside triphosphate hydrolase protein [Punctularia strigosozonata HHB-11173 SS5]